MQRKMTNLIFAPFSFAQHLLGYKESQISALEFKLTDHYNEDEVRAKLKNVLGDKVVIKNRIQLNDALYKMLNTEYLAVYLIFTLVLINGRS